MRKTHIDLPGTLKSVAEILLLGICFDGQNAEERAKKLITGLRELGIARVTAVSQLLKREAKRLEKGKNTREKWIDKQGDVNSLTLWVLPVLKIGEQLARAFDEGEDLQSSIDRLVDIFTFIGYPNLEAFQDFALQLLCDNSRLDNKRLHCDFRVVANDDPDFEEE